MIEDTVSPTDIQFLQDNPDYLTILAEMWDLPSASTFAEFYQNFGTKNYTRKYNSQLHHSTVITGAIEWNHFDVISDILLTMKFKPAYLNAFVETAVLKDRSEIIFMLLQHGADPDLVLQYATPQNKTRIIWLAENRFLN